MSATLVTKYGAHLAYRNKRHILTLFTTFASNYIHTDTALQSVFGAYTNIDVVDVCKLCTVNIINGLTNYFMMQRS